ncbi:helix-turn-helix domain-containing protein [Paenibacillus tepidiphilus]|uniref:helix-turn-helix domain-containing protein n=1 Tax=Paenibacillus tepidiphilus TaxID=2608683 RepID=UPI0013A5A527
MRVDFETLDKLCRYLNMDTGELIEYIEHEKPRPNNRRVFSFHVFLHYHPQLRGIFGELQADLRAHHIPGQPELLLVSAEEDFIVRNEVILLVRYKMYGSKIRSRTIVRSALESNAPRRRAFSSIRSLIMICSSLVSVDC